MKQVYDIYFTNSEFKEDETELEATSLADLCNLIISLRKELDIAKIDSIECRGTLRYYVCAAGYDKDNMITDYEWELGDFDDYKEAYQTFVKYQSKDKAFYFDTTPTKVQSVMLQVEECIEDDSEITCIDTLNEWEISRK